MDAQTQPTHAALDKMPEEVLLEIIKNLDVVKDDQGLALASRNLPRVVIGAANQKALAEIPRFDMDLRKRCPELQLPPVDRLLRLSRISQDRMHLGSIFSVICERVDTWGLFHINIFELDFSLCIFFMIWNANFVNFDPFSTHDVLESDRMHYPQHASIHKVPSQLAQ
jgi:hypothetical protein